MNAQFEKKERHCQHKLQDMTVEKKHWLTLEDMDYVKKVALK